MTMHTAQHDGADEQILTTRVVDREASPADWDALRRLAEADPGVWARLAEAQGEQAALEAALADAVRVADRVELPMPKRERVAGEGVLRWVLPWSGWLAAAAALLLAFVGPLRTPGSVPASSATTLPASAMPTLLAQAEPQQAFDRYVASGMARGRVVAQMPFIVLEANELETGGQEVLVVRRILERHFVDDVTRYNAQTDEHGSTWLIPVDTPQSPTDGAGSRVPEDTAAPAVF
jgi:hypothetical protein